MADSWDLSPNRGLGFADALAQGVQAGLQTYQGQVHNQQEMALKKAQLDSETQLRQLQMQKLRQDLAPVAFSAQKFATIDNAVSAGVLPESMKAKYGKEIIDSADTPEKLNFLNGLIDKKKAGDMRKLDPSAMQEQFGSGASVIQDNQIQSAPAQPAQPQQAPQDDTIIMTPNESKLYQGMLKSKYTNQLGMYGVQQRADAATMQHQAKLAEIQGKISTAQDQNDLKEWMTKYQDETKRYLGELMANNRIAVANQQGANQLGVAQTNAGARVKSAQIGANAKNYATDTGYDKAVDVADINADSRESVAKTRGSARGSKSSNPDLALVDDQIKKNSAAIDALSKPASGFSTELPNEIAAKKQALVDKSQRLIQLRGLVQKGKNYSDAASILGMTPGAPSASSGGAPGGAPAVIPQGNARPKFIPGPGTSQKIQALPDGQEFEVNGQVYVKQGGKAVPR